MERKLIVDQVNLSEYKAKLYDNGRAPAQRCETCAWWGRVGDAEGGSSCCKKDPGLVIPMMGPGGITGVIAIYPPKKGHDFCSHWRAVFGEGSFS